MVALFEKAAARRPSGTLKMIENITTQAIRPISVSSAQTRAASRRIETFREM